MQIYQFDWTYPQKAVPWPPSPLDSGSSCRCTFPRRRAARRKSSARCFRLSACPWWGSFCNERAHSSRRGRHGRFGTRGWCVWEPNLPWTIRWLGGHRHWFGRAERLFRRQEPEPSLARSLPRLLLAKTQKTRWSCRVVRLKPATNKIHLCCKSLLHLIVLSNIPFHSVFTFSFCIQLSCVYCFSYKTCPATYAVSSLRLGVVKRTPALIQNLESDYASQQFYEIACNKRWYYTSVGITWCQSSSTIRSWHRHAACSLGSEIGYRTVRL